MSLSINGLGPLLPDPRPGDAGGRATPMPTPVEPDRPTRDVAAPPVPADQVAAPADIAAGVDPELWEILSADERVFYLRSAATGPLTYGPGTPSQASPSPGSRFGGRIDVRI